MRFFGIFLVGDCIESRCLEKLVRALSRGLFFIELSSKLLVADAFGLGLLGD